MLSKYFTITRTWLQQRMLRLTPRTRRIALGAVGLIIIGLVGGRYAFLQPKVVFPTGPSLGTAQVSHAQPVKIIFNRPVKQSKLTYAIHPKLNGTWDLDLNIWTAQSTLTFTPTESPELATRYTIELNGIQGLIAGQPQNYLLSFQTNALPVFQSIVPAAGAVDVLPDAPIVVTFDTPIGDGVDVTIAVAPAATFAKPVIAKNTIAFAPDVPLQKSTAYTVNVFISTLKRNYVTKTVIINPDKTDISATSFTTIAAPSIQAYTPTGSSVSAAAPIRIEFKQAMERESTQTAFSVVPAAAGAFSWESDQVMVFTPSQPFTKGQTYTITIANTAKAASGFTPDENFSWPFTTIGAVAVSSFAPANGKTGVDVTAAVSVAFNQEVAHPSAESKFSIQPTVAGAFAWSGNTMTFTPSAALAYNQTYSVTVSARVQTVAGLDSASDFSAAFTTRTQSVMLKVPAYVQTHVYSCMISAARSALAFRGITVSEASIISKVGRDSTAWSGTWGGGNGVWGDPDADIVGPLDNGAATSPAGKTTTNVYWGYGSHWGPISSALTSYGVANEVRTGMTVNDLAQALTDGNPIIIWWVNGIWPSYGVNWKTPSGKQVRGVNGLHVQVVRGFTGTVDNPVSFTVTDSGYGYPGRAYDIGTFKAKWSWFGNTGIVVK